MHKANAKLKTWNFVRWVGVGLLFIAWIWSIWPAEKIESVLSFSSPSEFFEIDIDCTTWVQLINSAFTISFPKTIRYDEKDFVTFTIDPASHAFKEQEEDCGVVLEAYLDMPDVDIEPGTRIFEPLSIDQTQMILFKITADRRPENIKGDLWIHAITTDNQQSTNHDQRNPLFVIPLQIGLIDVIGIPIQYLRVAFLGLALVFLFGPVITKWLK